MMEFKKKDFKQLKNVLANIFDKIFNPAMIETQCSFSLSEFEEQEKDCSCCRKDA